MKLLKTIVWHWSDIMLLKWCTFASGIVIGALTVFYLRPYLWAIALFALICAIRPSYRYFSQ